MANMSREESALMVNRAMSNEEGFQEFYEQFHRLVMEQALRWVKSIGPASHGMYDLEDVYNEFWEHIWERMPTYDHTKSNLVTWLYMVIGNKAGMTHRKFLTEKAGKGTANVYLFDNLEGDDGDQLERISMIVDPTNQFVLSDADEIMIYEYIYSLRHFVEKLNRTEQIVYLSKIRGELTQDEIGSMLGITQSYISRIKRGLVEKAERLIERFERTESDISKAVEFSEQLLSSIPDDDLAEKLECNLATVKICREILTMVDLYGYRKGA